MILAKRTSPRLLPRPTTLQGSLGLRYERRVVKQLRLQGLDLEHNPWFEYTDGKLCSPDAIVYFLSFNTCFVLEIKLTWTPEAEEKLQKVYLPVVEHVTGLKVEPRIVVKSLCPGAAQAGIPVIHWLGRGRIEFPA